GVTDAILIILAERQLDVFRPQIRKFCVVVIPSSFALLLLLCPPDAGTFIVGLADQMAIEKSAKDEFTADMKEFGKQIGRALGRRPPGESSFKNALGNKKLGRKSVAYDLDFLAILWQALNKIVGQHVDTAGVEQQMRQLMEEREDLARFRGAVIHIDER